MCKPSLLPLPTWTLPVRLPPPLLHPSFLLLAGRILFTRRSEAAAAAATDQKECRPISRRRRIMCAMCTATSATQFSR
jgi:hypothetical protein